MRKIKKQTEENMAEAQRRIDKWVAAGDIEAILNLSFLKLTSLPRLPDNLKMLYCDENKLTSLPILPDSLTVLFCDDNKLTSLPRLPDNLKKLFCNDNKLTSLPTLPDSLTVLVCDHNKLMSLPKLPTSLNKLFCSENNLPEVYNNLNNEPMDLYINRIHKLQKSRINVTNSLRSHATEKKRNVFANTTFKNMPKNVVKEIAKYMNNSNLENIDISLKPSNIAYNKKRETMKKHKK